MLSQLRMTVILMWCPAVVKLPHKKRVNRIHWDRQFNSEVCWDY